MDKAVMSVRMKKWAGIIQEAATSGLTKTEFCARKGIDRRQFFESVWIAQDNAREMSHGAWKVRFCLPLTFKKLKLRKEHKDESTREKAILGCALFVTGQ